MEEETLNKIRSIGTLSSVAAMLVVIVAALAIAGCGSSDSDTTEAAKTSTDDTSDTSGNGAADLPPEFATLLSEAEDELTEWPGPTSSPKAASDNPLVFAIPCARAAEGCNLVNQGLEEGTEALGWRFTSPVDPEGSPDKAAAAIQQAVQEDADVIVLNSLAPNLMKPAIADARAAGVLVACAFCGEPDAVGPKGVSQENTLNFGKQGEMLAAFVATDSGGTASTVVLNLPSVAVVDERYKGWKETYPMCTTCDEAAYSDFTLEELGPPLGEKAQALLQSNPDADYLYVGADTAAEAPAQTLAQPGSAEAKLVSFDGNKPNIALIREGLQYATIANPLTWGGWMTMDNVNRELQGEPIEENIDMLPSRLITQENADEYEEGFTGDIDYAAKYEELWKTGSTTTEP